MEFRKPVLGITMGDPAGVGPEVLVKALSEPEVYQWCSPLILGDLGVLRQTTRRLGLDLEPILVESVEKGNHTPGRISVLPMSNLAERDRVPGRPTRAGAAAAAACIEKGARLALSGETHGIVTAPISKEALNDAGYHYPGHTEFLSHLAGDVKVVMMLAGPRLRVVLVTIHVALKLVPELLTPEKIITTARITSESLRINLGLERPHLAVAGLNPHAGESGMFGREEETVILPAINRGLEEGLYLTGPYPPDTLFYRAAKGEFDAVVCMYHDQGLIPFKLLHFKDGVNTTLGLPFIRTSVDHGTAYDLAGKDLADHESMLAAIRMAAEMARRRFGQS